MNYKHFFTLFLAFVLSISVAFAQGDHDTDHHDDHSEEVHDTHADEHDDDHHGDHHGQPAGAGDCYHPVHHDEDPDAEFDAVGMIMGHIADANYIHIGPLSIHLPVILWSPSKGLTVTTSNKFDHGHAVVDGYSIDHHGKVYSTECLERATLFGLFGGGMSNMFIDFSITKNVAYMLLAILILLLIFGSVAAHYKRGNMVPKGLSSWMEPLVVFVRDDIAKENIGEKKGERFTPFLLTVFFFILLNNLFGLIPFMGNPNISGNIAFTMLLSVVVLIIIYVNGNRDYWKHIFWMPGVPWPVRLLLAPIELVGTLTKPFALMMRLFANITAGHILILSLVGLVFIFKSIAIGPGSVLFLIFMFCLELLVAFLQAYIFTLLSALFIGMAVEEHDHH